MSENGKIEVVVIDERAAPLRDDNTDAMMGSVVVANSTPIVVVVSQDGVYVKKGVGKVALITPKSENQMSAEKADRESRSFEEKHRQHQEGEDPVTEKFPRVWQGKSNSGTEKIGG